MAYVINDDCINCGACAAGCPVEAISEGASHMEINADVCVDCGACAGVCPVGAPNPQQTTYNYSLNVFQDTKKEPEIKDIPCFRFFFDIKNIIRKATGVETDWVISNINITVLIYIFVRAIKR